MSDFNINTNFNLKNFDNAINDFNKSFSDSVSQSQKALQNNLNFEDVFNSVGEKMEPVKLGIEKTHEISPAAKMANDIGQGFSNSLNELNSIQRKAENDFETFASGGDISIHEVMISSQKSALAMQMAIQLRNQMLNAYNEFKNMTI